MEGRSRLPWIAWLALSVAAAGLLSAAIVWVASDMRVVEVLPRAGEERAAITAPLRVVFSRRPEVSSLESHFQIEPDAQGTWVVEGDEAVYQPDRALDPGVTYTATLQPGIRSQDDRELDSEFVWQFRTRHPDLLYLGRPEPGAEARQLFLAAPGGAPVQLTDHPQGVWDYTVHPQGAGIVYSVLREDGGADLWRMDGEGGDQEMLLACPEAACLNPAWSPDGGLLAYERRDIWAGAPNLDPKAGLIWLLDLEQEEERPLFDYEVALHSPVWAPRGQRLAYISPTLPGVEVYDLGTGELQQFGNQWGAPPAWSPDGARLVLPELLMAGEELAVRLVRVDLAVDHLADDHPAEESLADISGDEDLVKDVAPAWSPGGSWIAFARQFLDADRWTPGRQIWLSRPDASEAYGLPPEPMFDHYSLAWRPDGAVLAYARADLGLGVQAVPDVSVWIFDFNRGEARQAGQDAVLPKWLP